MLSKKQIKNFFDLINISAKTLPFKKRAALFILIIIFLISAGGILWSLNSLYSIQIPDYGGVLKEGVVGIPRFVNPLLVLSDADRDVTELVYSGLLTTDGKGNLIPALATKFSISKDGLSYIFDINPKAKWHDGKPVTSDDIIFTIKLAKNPMLQSPKRANWEGVEVEKINDYQVRFVLQKPFAPFLENATLGILPKHIWNGIPPDQISLSDFNIKAIGAGPFKIKKINRGPSGIITSYVLKANEDFVLGKPFIKYLIFNFYPSEEKLIEAYKNGKADSMGYISPKNADYIKSLEKNSSLKTPLLPRVFGLFFNQNNSEALAELKVRKALDLTAPKETLVKKVLSGYGTPIDSPIPPGVFGALKYETAPSAEKIKEAKKLLASGGWKLNEKSGILEKKSKKKIIPLEFTISTSNNPDFIETAEILKNAWKDLGIKVNLEIFEIGDLNQLVIRQRKYEALLFGEIVGRDPDPFAFWHSSQRNDPGLNIALYANIAVDKFLEEARTLFNAEKRKDVYEKFQKEVKKDIPAVFLYSPYYLYFIPNFLKGFEAENITMPQERFSGIHKWHIKTREIWPIFSPSVSSY
jgi:peptide/nickel transport system substrate-binding protein